MIKNNRNAISPIYLIISIIRRCIFYLIRFFSLLLNINDSLSYSLYSLSLSLHILYEGEKMMREYRTWYRNRREIEKDHSYYCILLAMKEITPTTTTNFKWYNTGTQGHRSSFLSPFFFLVFILHPQERQEAGRRAGGGD